MALLYEIRLFTGHLCKRITQQVLSSEQKGSVFAVMFYLPCRTHLSEGNVTSRLLHATECVDQCFDFGDQVEQIWVLITQPWRRNSVAFDVWRYMLMMRMGGC